MGLPGFNMGLRDTFSLGVWHRGIITHCRLWSLQVRGMEKREARSLFQPSSYPTRCTGSCTLVLILSSENVAYSSIYLAECFIEWNQHRHNIIIQSDSFLLPLQAFECPNHPTIFSVHPQDAMETTSSCPAYLLFIGCATLNPTGRWVGGMHQYFLMF